MNTPINTHDCLISEYKKINTNRRKLRIFHEPEDHDNFFRLQKGLASPKPSVNLRQLSITESISQENIIEAKTNLHNVLELEDSWSHKYISNKLNFASDNSKLSTNMVDFELRKRIVQNYLGNKKNPSIPKFHKEDVQKTKLSNIAELKEIKTREKTNYFYDTFCCLEQRKIFYFIRKKISLVCNKIVRNIIFDNAILLVILVNTVFILISDPNLVNLQDATDIYFLSIYTVEMVLKIFAFGFVKNANSYLRDNWNILDFFVVMIGWISFILTQVFGNSGFTQIGVLRTVRTLRPLKSIKSIAGLRVIMEALFGSLSGIKDTVIIIIFFFLIFAVGGMQMWQGNLLMRCINPETGAAISYDSYKTACTTDDECSSFNSSYESFFCQKVDKNPYYDALSFDNIQKSMMLVLVITTMEGWSEYYNYYRRTFKDKYYINEIILIFYFTLLLFIGGYYLINLFLAVINETYRKVDDKIKEDGRPKEKKLIDLLSLDNLRKTKSREENSEELLNKLKDEYCFIAKNKSNLAMEYQIFKDMVLLKANTPEDLYYLKQSLEDEAKKINYEFRTEKKALKKSITLMTATNNQNYSKTDSTKDQLIEKEIKQKLFVWDPTRKVSKIDVNRIDACIKRASFTFSHFMNSKRKEIAIDSKERASKGETVIEDRSEWSKSSSDKQSSKHNANNNFDFNNLLDQELEVRRRNLSVLNFNEFHIIHEDDISNNLAEISQENIKEQESPLMNKRSIEVEDLRSLDNSIDASFPNNIHDSLEVGLSQLSNECELQMNEYETCLSNKLIKDSQIPFCGKLSGELQHPKLRKASKLKFVLPLLSKRNKQKKKYTKSFIPEYSQINFDKLNQRLSLENIINSTQPSSTRIMKEDISMIHKGPNELKFANCNKRRNSIKQIRFKYPESENRLSESYKLDDNDVSISSHANQNSQVQVRQQLQSYRENGAYTYNLLNFNFKVKDNFNIQNCSEIFNSWNDSNITTESIEQTTPQISVPEFDNATKYKTHLKQQFVPYRKIILTDKDIINYNHALKNLPSKTFEFIPIHNLASKKVIFEVSKKEDLKEKLIQKARNSRVKSRSSLSLMNSNTFMKLCSFTSSMKTSNLSSNKNRQRKGRKLFDNYETLDTGKYNSINKNFLLEEKLAKINKEKENEEQRLVQRQNINFKKEATFIHKFDKQSSYKKNIIWSNQDVLNFEDDFNHYAEWNNCISEFENLRVMLWSENPVLKQIDIIKYVFFRISMSQYFDLFIILVVLVNAFFMALDGNLLLPEEFNNLETSKYVFNSIFIFEFIVKIFGNGPVLYFSEVFSYLDIVIFVFALIDIFTLENDQSKISQLSFLRVLRIFRVLRLLKVLRKIKSVRKLVNGIAKTISSIYYILLILLIFIFIFQLIGMTLFSVDDSYSSFIKGFYTTFQLLTLENWNTNIIDLNLISQWAALYLILWVFIGNFVLFNLFLSILLESFIEEPYGAMRFPLDYPDTFKAIELMEAEYKIKLKRKKKKIEDENSGQSEELSETEDLEIEDHSLTYEKAIKRLFADNQCEYSLYLFSQKEYLRGKLYTLISTKAFEKMILVIISLSTLDLIIESFITLEWETVSTVFDSFDMIFNIIFILEATLKIISMGFTLDKGTYLRDNWNKLDFLIVIVSFFDIEQICYRWTYPKTVQNSLGYLKVLRLLRILRPLRFISHNKQLKLTINCLIDSIQAIVSVVLIVVVVFFIMSIIGITLFNNELDQNCSTFTNFLEIMAVQNITQSLNPTLYQNQCYSQQGTIDIIPLFKFSNIFESMITSYVLSSLEGWPDIMASYVEYYEIYGLFFVFYLIIVSYFFMNLFVGVMFSTYNDAIQKEKKKGIQNDWKAQRYLDFLFLLDTAKPDYITFRRKTGRYAQWTFKVISTNIFENFIIFIIVMNMITLAIDYEGSEDQFTNVILKLNYFFTSIFIVECLLKLIAHSPAGYFNNSWNRFDFFVVIASIFDVVITNTFIDSNVKFLKSFQIFRILRVLRVTRVLRLFKTLKGLEKILQTIYWSMQALGNVLLLLFLVIFIFAVLGSNIVTFVQSDYSDSFLYYDQYFNFNNFYTGMLLVLRSVTGENWPAVMMELANMFDLLGYESTVIYLFMISLNFFLTVIMINLLLLVVLEQYDELNAKEENPIIKFNDILISYNTAWNSLSTEEEQGYTIDSSKLKDLIGVLSKSDFLLLPSLTLDSLKRLLLEFKFIVDSGGKAYYHDVLFKILKKEYGLKDKSIKLVSAEEKKISRFILKKIKSTLKRMDPANYKLRKEQLSIYNPMPSHYLYKTSFLFVSHLIRNYQQNKAKNLPTLDKKI